MKAAVYYGKGDIRVEEHPMPVAGPGEVVVRVGAAGICGSDAAEYTLGPQLIRTAEDGSNEPVVLGHEFAGTVESVGEGVTGLVPGAQVVCGAGVSCGACTTCRSGRTNLCRSYHTLGFHRDGGLAGFVRVPAGILLDVTGAQLPMDTLALAQPMAVAVHAVRRSGLTAGQDAVVIGAGGIGAFLSYAAAQTGARVLVVDRSAERLDLARTLGATETLLAGDQDLADRLASLGWEPDVFFEVSGSAAGLEQVLAAALPGATIVPVGIQKTPPPEALGKWTLREYTILGTVALVFADDLPEAVRLLGERDDWSDFTGTIIPLDDVVTEGIELLACGRAPQIKTLIDPWATAARDPQHVRTSTP